MSDTLLLRDELGHTLECEILKLVDLADENYALLMPVHQPVQILAWEDGGMDEESSSSTNTGASAGGEDYEEGGLADLEEQELEAVIPTAQAVLGELNLKLRISAYTLTVEGELPEPIEETAIEIANGDGDDDIEEYQLLSTFFHEERQFGVFAPLDPLLFFAAKPNTAPSLVSPEEDSELFTRLQDRLLDLAD
ncbi:MAG: DUF3727 domain-containing protein [Cyanobacteria bacterium P01_E01_bin.34]